MQRKTESEYITRLPGFPVLIRNAPFRRVRGDWALDLSPDRLRQAVLWALAHKPAPLTGSEVRYVRHWMELPLRDFAELCAMTSHQSVMKWESKEDQPTGMHRSTEILLRCRILEALPEEVWERFEVQSERGREGFVHRLEALSDFESDADPVMIELVTGGDTQPWPRFGAAGVGSANI